MRTILEKTLEDRTEEEESAYDKKRDDAQQELQLNEMEIPSDEENIMPTRLGMVLKASEAYALDRYLIEAVTIWTRLFPVIPEKFLKDMEEKNNHFMFLLNSSLVMYFAGIGSLLAALVGCYFVSFPHAEIVMYLKTHVAIPNGFKMVAPPLYLFFSGVLVMFGYMLYRVAVNAAEDFSLFYRAGFDLYRMDLLKQLHYEPPINLGEEKNLWMDISSFLAVGHKLEWNLDDIDYPPYHYPDLQKQPRKRRK